MATAPNAVLEPTRAGRVTDPAKRRERFFFGGMAVALTATVFLGFAPTFYLHRALATPNVLTPSLLVHGTAFTAWMVLLVVQTSLIAARRVEVHRRLGALGAGLAALMVVLGAYVAITRTRDGLIVPPEGLSLLTFLTIPLALVIVFPALVGAALLLRRRTDYHKRLMMIATLELATAAIARWPLVAPLGPVAFFGLTDLFIVAIAVYDWRTRGRVHPATLWGGLFLAASQPLRLLLGFTGPWLAFAGWLTS